MRIGCRTRIILNFLWHRHRHGGLLVGTVGVDEAAAEVDNLLAAPADYHAGLLGDGGHNGGFEVLLVGILKHQVNILGVDDHSHTLLTLADGQLGAVESSIFLGDTVEVDL